MQQGAQMQAESAREDWSGVLTAMAETRSREQFLSLYEHFAPRVKGFLVGMGCREAQAEELAQETMINVWRKARQFQPERASASTWIFRIARNLRIDQVRREGPGTDPRETSPDEPSPDHPDGTADHGRVREALSELPLLQAQAVYRSYYLGQSHSEIAAGLQIPLGSVKSNLRLAFRALRRSLGVSP